MAGATLLVRGRRAAPDLGEPDEEA
jgi:hypothetical protein